MCVRENVVMSEGETIVCERVVCEEIVKQLCMSVNELCVRKLRVKELCVKELRVQKFYVCVWESRPPKRHGWEQDGTSGNHKDANWPASASMCAQQGALALLSYEPSVGPKLKHRWNMACNNTWLSMTCTGFHQASVKHARMVCAKFLHTCHAKRRSTSPSATPATQTGG